MATDVQVKSWVEKRPGMCGGDACIRGQRITVYGIIEWKQLGLTDAEILESIQGLTPDDLEIAWAYYAENREEIDDAIRLNNED